MTENRTTGEPLLAEDLGDAIREAFAGTDILRAYDLAKMETDSILVQLGQMTEKDFFDKWRDK